MLKHFYLHIKDRVIAGKLVKWRNPSILPIQLKKIFLILLQRYWLPTHYYNVFMKQHFYKERPN
jgi:hypothetical protein